MAKIVLKIRLTPTQTKVDQSRKRFKILKCGRRWGKTRLIAKWLITNAISLRDKNGNRIIGKHWYVTRTLALAREEVWFHVLNLLPRHLVLKVDERLLTVWLTDGSSISMKSAEKEDNLRGRGLASCALDEAAFIKPNIWEQIIRPQLADFMGPALIASSPKKGWFTALFNKYKDNKDPQWDCFHFTICDNPHIAPEEIEEIRSKTPANTWLQEYMAEEVSDQGQVYDEFSQRNIYDPSQMFVKAKEYKTGRGLDWGVADPTGCVWAGVSPEGYLVLSDEHEQRGWDVPRHASVIQSKSAGYQNIAATVLDGTAFRKESSLTSVADQFSDNGIHCLKSERDVQSSLAIVKRFLRGDGEKPWLYISARCPKLIQYFQEWEHGDHEPDVAAAARYIIVHAVTRRWTALADYFPKISEAVHKPVSEKEAARILAQHARIVPTVSRKKSWSLTEYGVPG